MAESAPPPSGGHHMKRFKTHSASLLSRTVAAAAASAVGLGLVAAGPASAEPNNTNSAGKKSCTLRAGSNTWVIDDGLTITVTTQSGNKTKLKCQDGKWVEVAMVGVGNAPTFGIGSSLLTAPAASAVSAAPATSAGRSTAAAG